MTPDWTDAWVRGMRIEAEDVIALELARGDGQPWAPAAAGASPAPATGGGKP